MTYTDIPLTIVATVAGPVPWSTSSRGSPVLFSPPELAALAAHLASCYHSRGRMFDLRLLDEAIRGFAASHFMTGVVLIVAISALTCWIA